MSRRHHHVLPFLALTTAGCLWGTGFFFGKIALTEMSVTTMVLFRFAFACVGLLPALFYDRPRFEPNEWGWLLIASLLGVPIQFLLQFKGLSLTTVSHASLMVGTFPVLLAAAAVVFARERPHLGGWFALAGSAAGAALIALSGKNGPGTAGPTLAGDLLVVASLIVAVVWVLISKRLMRRHTPVMVTAVVFWIGTVMLAVAAFVSSGVPSLHYSPHVWAAVAAQGIFATLTTTILWNWALTRVPAAQAGVFVNLEPLVGAILGVALLNESLGVMAIAGGVLIVGGAVYFSFLPGHVAPAGD